MEATWYADNVNKVDLLQLVVVALLSSLVNLNLLYMLT